MLLDGVQEKIFHLTSPGEIQIRYLTVGDHAIVLVIYKRRHLCQLHALCFQISTNLYQPGKMRSHSLVNLSRWLEAQKSIFPA